MNFGAIITISCLLLGHVVGAATEVSWTEPLYWKKYHTPPQSWEAKQKGIPDEVIERGRQLGLRSIVYEGARYQGRTTQVFAYYGVPSDAQRLPDGKVPGIILVHGGGGTAFETWVKSWVDRGYAALAMDTCGAYPMGEHPQRPFSNDWARLPEGGPKGWGGFAQIEAGEPIEDHWMLQATAAIVLGHSWLRAQPEVDAEKTGVTGISWGAVLTCNAIGADPRFKFAVPVYGCGYLHESSTWVQGPLKKGSLTAECWAKNEDPSLLLRHATTPVLWLNGTNDFAFPLDSWLKSGRSVKGQSLLSMPLRMPHGHGGAGESPEIIHAFANQHVNKGKSLVEVLDVGVQEKEATVSWEQKSEAESRIVSASLIYTQDDHSPWKDRLWEEKELGKVDAGQTMLKTELPQGVKFWYFHLTDDRGLSISAFPD